MTELRAGMYVQALNDLTVYDENFYKQTIEAGWHGTIKYVGVALSKNKDVPALPVIVIDFRGHTLAYIGMERVEKFKDEMKLLSE